MASVVEVRRAGLVESQHVVHVAVAGPAGNVIARSGDAGLVIFARSAVKPIQALPLVDDRVLEHFGLDDEALALACASHSGEAVHIEVARRVLTAIEAGEEDLACGAHAPFDEAAAAALRTAGQAPTRVHNNCSGKHVGMLALARAHGWPLAGYHEAGHPVQRRVLAEMSRWCDIPEADVAAGVDGCGVPTFAVPLHALAGAFARLAGAAAGGDTAPARVLAAMTARPLLVAGSGRLCTALLEATSGRVVEKVGAEGVYAALLADRQMGIGLKVADGAKRAAEPALIGVLRVLGAIDEAEVAMLQSFAHPEVTNTRGETVGDVRVRIQLERA
jgi:L-asparaginase II